jgi:hypothetical protein
MAKTLTRQIQSPEKRGTLDPREIRRVVREVSAEHRAREAAAKARARTQRRAPQAA